MTSVQQFHHFFDDAAIFPPGLAPLDKAVHDHLDRRDKPVNKLIGPLILPLEKLAEAANHTGDHVLDVSAVITTEEIDTLRRSFDDIPNIDIVSVEVKFPGPPPTDFTWMDQLEQLAAERASVSIFMELPAALVTDDTARRLRAMGAGLKFRTGGIRAELFPTAEELTQVLSTAVHAALPFKLTAGLHRAIRYTDETTGFPHFGFLNIAAAVEELRAGHGDDAALHALTSDDAHTLAHTVATGGSWRESFRSFGTCSVTEPLETLMDVELISGDDLRP